MSVNEYVFDNLTEEGAYWLGMLASDGYILKNGFGLTLKSEDKEHIERLKKFLDFTGEVKDRNVKCNNGKVYKASYITICSKRLKEVLKSYGIVERKSNLEIDFLSYIPDKLKIFFIFGFFDGDGSIISPFYKNGEKRESHRCILSFTANYTLLNSISYFLARYYNIESGLRKVKKTERTHLKYEMYICRTDSQIVFFREYLKLNYTLKRKKNRCLIWNEIKEKRILEIKEQKLKSIQNREKKNFCCLCGERILENSKYCVECGYKVQRRVERPSRDVLKYEIRNYPFIKLSEKYGVSDNAIRKWCKSYNLPYKSTVIKNISDIDWLKI